MSLFTIAADEGTDGAPSCEGQVRAIVTVYNADMTVKYEVVTWVLGISARFVVLGSNTGASGAVQNPQGGAEVRAHAFLADRNWLPERLLKRVIKLVPRRRAEQRPETTSVAQADFRACQVNGKDAAYVCIMDRSLFRFKVGRERVRTCSYDVLCSVAAHPPLPPSPTARPARLNAGV